MAGTSCGRCVRERRSLRFRAHDDAGPLPRDFLDRKVRASERQLSVSVLDPLRTWAPGETAHEALLGLIPVIRPDAAHGTRNTLHPRSFREIDQVGVLLVGGRHGFRRPKLAVEPPEVVVLLNLRVVDVHLRRGPGEVGLAGLVVVEVRGVGAAGLHGVGGKDGFDNDASFADCFQAFGQLFDSFEPAFLPQLKQGESCGGSLKRRGAASGRGSVARTRRIKSTLKTREA